MGLWLRLKTRIFVDKNVRLGKRFHLGILSYVGASRDLTIGDDVYVGKFCTIQCNGSIGRGCLIANNVGIVGRRDHDFRRIGALIRLAPWVGNSVELSSLPANEIVIREDVWIGYGAILLSGISIGRGAVIAAGSVVSTDIEPYAIVAGNPAQVVGRRFEAREIVEHERAIAERHL